MPYWNLFVFYQLFYRSLHHTRCQKCFPKITKWSGEITFYILDETITQDVFEEHLAEAGNFIGIGRFRPRNNGYYGRFKVDKVDWSTQN